MTPNWLARRGVDRSLAVRRLARVGHPRLRRARARVHRSRVLRTVVAPGRRWLSAGPIAVSAGLGYGLLFSKRDLPLDHPHLGGIAYGNLEPPVQEALRRHVAPGSVFYDVGANVGFFSMLAARLAGPQGRVFAFEPVPANAAAIRLNTELNGFTQVEVIERALGSDSRPAHLQVVDEASWSKLADYGSHPGTQELLAIDTVAVDELVAGGLPPPDVAKIDVEGAEIAVLEGMRDTIARHRPAIVCELHDTNAEFVALADEMGYMTMNLDGPEPVAEADGGIHALAVPLPERGSIAA